MKETNQIWNGKEIYMANYYAKIRTNYFSVVNSEALKILISCLSTGDKVEIFEEKQENGKIKYAFGCTGSINGLPVKNQEGGEEDNLEAFYTALQQLLDKDDAIILTEIGSEKLSYLVSQSTVITKEDIQCVNSKEIALELAREMLGNKEYQTQQDY